MNPKRFRYWALRPAIRSLLRGVHTGKLRISLPDGSSLERTGREPGPSATMAILRPWTTLRRILTGGGLGFADAYLARDWDTDDLAATLELFGRNLDLSVRRPGRRRTLETARRLWQRLTTRRHAEIESIDEHYNLGNDFYAAWLDESMTYSSGVFTGDTPDLEAAQREKYRRLAALADLHPDDHVLEIGCGWGGFAEYAAGEIGCRVTGLTLSTEQAEFARDRLKRAGLDDRTDIKLLDFRDETGQYDKVVSIEMIESIPADLWQPLFSKIARSLKPGGRAAMQAITIADDLYESLLERNDFISKHIFPGGTLPSVAELRALATTNGMTLTEGHPHGPSYAETLRRWRNRFEGAWPAFHNPGFDNRFYRTWRYYLAYCEAGFEIGRINVHQIALVDVRP